MAPNSTAKRARSPSPIASRKKTLYMLLPRPKSVLKKAVKKLSQKPKGVRKATPPSTPLKEASVATPVILPAPSAPIKLPQAARRIKIKLNVQKPKVVEVPAVIDSDADSDSDADDVDEDVTDWRKQHTIIDPMTGLNTRVHWDWRVRTARAKEVLAKFEKRGIKDPKAASEVHWVDRKSQNVLLVLLDEENGSHLIQDFAKRKYWKVLRRIFPEGVLRPKDLPEEDLLHIYTQYGIARQFIIFDLDFMPGVTIDDIERSLTLHFDPVRMVKMFDASQLPSFFKCQQLPLLVESYDFKTFDEMHVEFQKKFGGSNAMAAASFKNKDDAAMWKKWKSIRPGHNLGIKSKWDEESSYAYLQNHRARDWSKDVKTPVMFDLKPIDWNQKTSSRAAMDDDDVDPFDCGPRVTEEELEAAFA
ncbi:uncharacterized protein PAC_18446 [Phialocephala subalpina]|uniref:Uncharacterized protein n=1 Tax=Phialocephala subalpina TaxID=576137 RepID=A0A1L7XU91_9HELO|nr:uncharacterized protein PAC_18446 [Phialocephala subalpina]